MGLESGNYIYDLVQSNPPAGDQRKEGDDHLRLIKKIIQQTFPHITGPTLPVSTGTAAAQAITHLFAPPAYIAGMVVAWVAGFTSTGPMTLAVNGLGSKNVFMAFAPVGAGNIPINSVVVAMYDGIQFQIYGSTGVGGYLPIGGGTLTGALTISPTAQLILSRPAGSYANILGQTAGSLRWALDIGDGSAETGSGNTGSNFTIRRFSDAGAFLDTPLTINRASGAASFADTLAVSPVSGPANFVVSAVAGQGKTLWGQTSGVTRWQLMLGNSTAEGGSNAGSDFAIQRFTDAGALIDTPLTITRATGYVTLGAGLIAAGPLNISNTVASASRSLNFQTSGSQRWQLVTTAEAEGGSNAGSNFWIQRYTDAGATIDTPLSIKRSTGVTTFSIAIVNGPSDRSLKENIAPLDSSLDKIMALKGVSFNFIKDKTKRHIGLIAQDVAPIVPEVMQDYLQPDEEPKLAIDYTRLVPVLIEAIKELTARVKLLEEEVSAQGN